MPDAGAPCIRPADPYCGALGCAGEADAEDTVCLIASNSKRTRKWGGGRS